MSLLAILFWACVVCVGYTYVGYPLLLYWRARWRPRPVKRGVLDEGVLRGGADGTRNVPTTSIVLCVHNEEARLPGRLDELCGQVRRGGLHGSVVVVSDGSTDGTVAAAQAFPGVRVIDIPDNVGKAAALTLACQSIGSDVIVFADVRQTWADDAVPRLLENFADPQVGAVSGDLVLRSADGVLAGVGLYWRFEKWLRRAESLVYSQVGVTGAISAVRRELFRRIPQGTILDDVYWPLQVAMQGYRVIHDERAIAYDRLPDRPRDEFRRKVRTLSGNYQLACLLPASLLPWRNPVWLAWISHKLLRLVVPWAFLAMLVTSALLADEEIYLMALFAQLAGYGIAFAGLVPAVGRRIRLAGAASSFLVLNAAAGLALLVAATGRASKSWHKIDYTGPSAVRDPCTMAGSR